MATVRQCPHCELRFTNSNELEDHISRDHDQAEPEERKDSRSARRRPDALSERAVGARRARRFAARSR